MRIVHEARRNDVVRDVHPETEPLGVVPDLTKLMRGGGSFHASWRTLERNFKQVYYRCIPTHQRSCFGVTLSGMYFITAMFLVPHCRFLGQQGHQNNLLLADSL